MRADADRNARGMLRQRLSAAGAGTGVLGTATGLHRTGSFGSPQQRVADVPRARKQTEQKGRRRKEGRSAAKPGGWPAPRQLPAELAGLGAATHTTPGLR